MSQEGDNHHEELKTCPFNGQKCIAAECMLWMELNITKPGTIIAQRQGTCALVAGVMIGSTPKMMMMPPQNLGGLNIPKLG